MRWQSGADLPENDDLDVRRQRKTSTEDGDAANNKQNRLVRNQGSTAGGNLRERLAKASWCGDQDFAGALVPVLAPHDGRLAISPFRFVHNA